MPVFISHRTADDHIAREAYDRLKFHHGIECYLDDIDARLKTADDRQLTKILVDAINKCTNLLAVVTQNTTGSWWVPFEIGVAKQAPRVICSVTNLQDLSLPGYLKEWPRLRGQSAIDQFAYLYKRQRDALQSRVMQKSAGESGQVNTVDDFHRQLKAALGQ